MALEVQIWEDGRIVSVSMELWEFDDGAREAHFSRPRTPITEILREQWKDEGGIQLTDGA